MSFDEEKLTEIYTALHEGREPDEFIPEQWSKPSVDRILGLGTEIQYKKKVTDGVPSYHHPWADQAQPTIAVTNKGEAVIFAGRYETTRRGIEDRVLPGMETVEYLKQPYVQRESLPGVPKSLITLGTLEFIRYKFETPTGWEEGELVFSPSNAPEIAHDQKGNLHILHGKYQITSRGVEDTMRTSRSSHLSYDNPRRSRRRSNPSAAVSRRHATPAATSSMTSGERAQRMILNSIIVGGVATLTAVGLNMAIDRFWPTWSNGAKAATKIIVGLGGGLGLAYAIPTYPSIAAGVSVGGVIDGFLDLWAMYIAPRIASMTTTTTQTTQTTQQVTPPVQPSQQALLPGGIPRQYAGYSPAACGVPAGY